MLNYRDGSRNMKKLIQEATTLGMHLFHCKKSAAFMENAHGITNGKLEKIIVLVERCFAL